MWLWDGELWSLKWYLHSLKRVTVRLPLRPPDLISLLLSLPANFILVKQFHTLQILMVTFEILFEECWKIMVKQCDWSCPVFPKCIACICSLENSSLNIQLKQDDIYILLLLGNGTRMIDFIIITLQRSMLLVVAFVVQCFLPFCG